MKLTEYCKTMREMLCRYEETMDRKITNANHKGKDLDHRSFEEWLDSLRDSIVYDL